MIVALFAEMLYNRYISYNSVPERNCERNGLCT